MAILKIRKKQNPYVILDKTFLQDPNLSCGGKGLLAYLLTLPEDWTVRVKDLKNHFTDGKKSIYARLKELKDAGYVVHRRERSETGAFLCGTYDVYEIPAKDEGVDASSKNEPSWTDQPHAAKGVVDEPEVKIPHSLLGDDANRDDANCHDEKRHDLINNDNNKYLNNKIITAATKDAVVLSGKDAPLLVAAHLQVIENGKLSQEQKLIVEQTVKALCDDSVSLEPVRLMADVITVLEDSRAFTLSGNLFYKKLNTVKKQIQSGMWQSPLAPASIVSSTQKLISPIDADFKKLNAQIADLERQKQSFERGVCDERFKHQPEYLASCKKMVVSLDAEIASLMRAKDRMKSESGKTTAQQGECNATSH